MDEIDIFGNRNFYTPYGRARRVSDGVSPFNNFPKAPAPNQDLVEGDEIKGDGDGIATLMRFAISHVRADGSLAWRQLLATIPGGSIESFISGTAHVCPCKAKDGTIGAQMTFTGRFEINGGIGFVLRDRNLKAVEQQGGKYIQAVDQRTGKAVKDSDGINNRPMVTDNGATIGITTGLDNCETGISGSFDVKARGTGGFGFWGGEIESTFATVTSSGIKWGWKPEVSGSWGAGQPVGLRVELAGGINLVGKWASKD